MHTYIRYTNTSTWKGLLYIILWMHYYWLHAIFVMQFTCVRNTRCRLLNQMRPDKTQYKIIWKLYWEPSISPYFNIKLNSEWNNKTCFENLFKLRSISITEYILPKFHNSNTLLMIINQNMTEILIFAFLIDSKNLNYSRSTKH